MSNIFYNTYVVTEPLTIYVLYVVIICVCKDSRFLYGCYKRIIHNDSFTMNENLWKVCRVKIVQT